MKVAYFTESPADAVALRILSEAILREATEPVTHAGLEHRGWPFVKNALPAVLKQLHYRSDAVGLALIVDSNGKPPHLPTHDLPYAPDPMCRLCQLRRTAVDTLRQVRPRPHLPPLKVAIGLAVPAVEAWLLCGVDPRITEAAWITARSDRPSRMPYTTAELKSQLYGTARPALGAETTAMQQAAMRLAEDLSSLMKGFPHGFGALVNNLRTW